MGEGDLTGWRGEWQHRGRKKKEGEMTQGKQRIILFYSLNYI